MPDTVARRRVLAGALGVSGSLTLGACTGSRHPGASATRPGADEVARRAAADRELGLALDARGLAAQPAVSRAVAGRAAAAASTHDRHAEVLLSGLPPTPSSGTPAGTSASGAAAAVPSPPRTRTASGLAAEQTAAAEATQASLGPLSGGSARLLASVAASDLALAALVRAAAR
jgi:hypothetical protein